VLVLVGLFAWQAWRARAELLAARDSAQTLSSQVASGNLTAARGTVASLRRHTARAHDTTDGWLWDAASHVPWAGRNVSAVQIASATLDTVAQRALPVLMEVAGRAAAGELSPHHGRWPLERISRLAPDVTSAARAVHSPAHQLAQVDAAGLVGPLPALVGKLQAQVSSASSALDDVATAFRVLPAAAGGHGARNYLLLVQNNAEVRATGGMPGSWAVIRASDGRLRIMRQGSAGDLDRQPPATAPARVSAAEKALYGSDLGTQLRDVNFTPDFPRVAQMAAALVSQQTGVPLDGVFSIDPVALSFLLQGTGPVSMPVGPPLTAANAVSRLLNQVYFEFSAPDQDAYFQLAARRIFTAVSSGRGEPLDVVRALVRGVSERRLLAWSSRPDLARALSGTALAGALTADAPRAPQVGVFLNDATATKLEYYLRASSHVSATCHGNRQQLDVRTTLHSLVPAHRPLPLSVTGPGLFAPRRNMLLNVQLYSPVGGRLDSLRVNGRSQTIAGGTSGRRQVAIQLVNLRTGSTVVVQSTMTSGPGQTGDVLLSTTPGIQPAPDPVTVPSACG
jgi:hypothetical protein